MKPEVTLINVSDQREEAWRFSRPGFDHSNLDMEEIGAMDMSLNSTCMLTFQIHSSIAFRDWLFSIRPIFPWARSSRSAPLTNSNTVISSEFNMVGDERIRQVLRDIAQGVPQDQARENLPLSMSTAYTVTMDFRTVCGMIRTMHYMNKDMFDTYGLLFNSCMTKIPGYDRHKVKPFMDAYILTDEEIRADGTLTTGNMVFGSFKMKAALMSQFLRTSHAIVKTALWNKIHSGGYEQMALFTQKDIFKVAFYMDKDAYDNLMRLRSHWFADWSNDMWGSMINDHTMNMTTAEFWNFIPNGNGKADPYHRDMISRVTGEEHNLPCPIMLEYPDLIQQRLELHGGNPVIWRYVDLVEQGFIKDNPSNELRRQYVQNNQ